MHNLLAAQFRTALEHKNAAGDELRVSLDQAFAVIRASLQNVRSVRVRRQDD